MRAGRLLLALSFSLLALNFSLLTMSAQAEEGARGWLERMTQAFQQQNYRGVLMYGDGQQWQTLAITHAVIDGVEQEKLQHLTGLPRKMVRHGHDIVCIHPGDHSPRLNSELSNPLHGFSRVMDVDGQYHFTLGGVERIAGRFAQRLQVTPVDADRYGYQLWLDQVTGLLLRSDLLNHQQQVLERFQFAQIEIGADIPASAFEPDDQGHKLTLYPVSPDHEQISTAGIGWLPGWVPSGFHITAVIQAGSPQPQMAAEQNNESVKAMSKLPVRLMYSDGLAAFTLFIDPVSQEHLPEMTSRWGATAAVVRYRDHSASADDGDSPGRLRVTVVGELPADTMIRIATSVIPATLAEQNTDSVNSALSAAEE